MAAGLLDLPNDVIWIIFKFMLFSSYGNNIPIRTWDDSNYSFDTCIRSRVGHETMSFFLNRLSFNWRVRKLLKTKCKWKNGYFCFIKGSINVS